jgi:hypothetical protein
MHDHATVMPWKWPTPFEMISQHQRICWSSRYKMVSQAIEPPPPHHLIGNAFGRDTDVSAPAFAGQLS